jgi:hypothetical protein
MATPLQTREEIERQRMREDVFGLTVLVIVTLVLMVLIIPSTKRWFDEMRSNASVTRQR